MSGAKFVVTRRVVFWEPTASPHKAPFFEAIARLAPNVRVIECADRELGADRASQGWSVAPAAGYARIVAPDDQRIEEIVAEGDAETLHVFSGIRWVPTIVKGLAVVRKTGARFAIQSEPRVREGWKGELRYLQSWLTEGWLRRRAEFVLAIGRNGPPWFAGVGYAPERIVPFAYFVDPPKSDAEPPVHSFRPEWPLRIGYLGRLVEEKGVRDFIRAAALLGGKCIVRVGGAGPDEAGLRALCAELGVSAQFQGVIPMPDVGAFLAGLDVLILPSRSKDGWGVVVSEALMCGTAVVATDLVGASLVLDPPWLGRVVPRCRPDRIVAAILELRSVRAFDASARARRAHWARSALSATAGAQHLLRTIVWSEGRGSRPVNFHLARGIPLALEGAVSDLAPATEG